MGVLLSFFHVLDLEGAIWFGFNPNNRFSPFFIRKAMYEQCSLNITNQFNKHRNEKTIFFTRLKVITLININSFK